MSDSGRTSIVRVLPKQLIVTNYNSSPLSAPGWLLSILPTLLGVIGIAVAYSLQLWPSMTILVVLTLVFFGFFVTIASVQLQSQQTVTITGEGVREEYYGVFGRMSMQFSKTEITNFSICPDTGDMVRLVLDFTNGRQLILLTVPIDSLQWYAPRITELLNHSYVLTVPCTSAMNCVASDEIEQPDFVIFEPELKRILLDMPDNRRVEVPFSHIDCVPVVGKKNATECEYLTGSRVFEYLYQPALRLRDGSEYLLQRFRSIESAPTTNSDALISAHRFADYVTSCLN
jgi:hypothetical protein